MKRLVIGLALVAACGGGTRTGTAPSGQSAAAEPTVAKKVAVSWGIEQHGELADVFLATTDETGKQVSHPLGRYKGICTAVTPAPEMRALTALACRTGSTGTELHAVVEHGDEVVILKLGIDGATAPDPMAREEVVRVKVPLGAKIEAGS